MTNSLTPTSSAEVLEGAKAIAEFMGLAKVRSVYSGIESNSLPVFRIGKKICARRSVLQTFMTKQEAANAPALSNRKAA